MLPSPRTGLPPGPRLSFRLSLLVGMLALNLLPALPGFYQLTSQPVVRLGIFLLALGSALVILCLMWRNHLHYSPPSPSISFPPLED